MADPRLTVARRELAGLRREKTIVLALLIQLFIAAFSSFLVVGLVSLYDPGSVEGYGLDVGVTGDDASDLVAAVEGVEGLTATAYDDAEAARAAFDDRRVDAVLVADRVDGTVRVRALVPSSNIRTTLTVVQVREALRAYERAERDRRSAFLETTPLALPEGARSSPYYGFTYTVLIPLLLFLPVFISGSIAVDSITEEIDRGTLELLRVSPASLTRIVEGKLLAAAGLAPAQAALWIALLRLNGTAVGGALWLLVLVGALALLVVAMGLLIALLAPDRRAAQFVYSLGTLTVFGAATLLPAGPANTVARLAIDSGGGGLTAAVGAYAVAAAAAFLVVRGVVGRLDAADL